MNKIRAFFRKYKIPSALLLFLIFTVAASFSGPQSVIEEKEEVNEETKETRAFITKGNDEPLDIQYKDEVIQVMPEERIPKGKTSPEKENIRFPENLPEDNDENQTEAKDPSSESSGIPASAVSPFSPVFPLPGKILKSYSSSPIHSPTMGDWRTHEAIDISAFFGEEVKSAEKGTVKAVGKDPLLGFFVLISHDGGFETFYANLHGETTVIESQIIEKGHVIGYVGESTLTESADEPHLHFEMRKNGKRVNPEEYIR